MGIGLKDATVAMVERVGGQAVVTVVEVAVAVDCSTICSKIISGMAAVDSQ